MFTFLLLGCAAISIITYLIDETLLDNLYVGIVLFVVIFLQTAFSFMQEKKTAQLQDTFTVFKLDRARCRYTYCERLGFPTYPLHSGSRQ
jgi:hypothetical protein